MDVPNGVMPVMLSICILSADKNMYCGRTKWSVACCLDVFEVIIVSDDVPNRAWRVVWTSTSGCATVDRSRHPNITVYPGPTPTHPGGEGGQKA